MKGNQFYPNFLPSGFRLAGWKNVFAGTEEGHRKLLLFVYVGNGCQEDVPAADGQRPV